VASSWSNNGVSVSTLAYALLKNPDPATPTSPTTLHLRSGVAEDIPILPVESL